MSDSFGTVPTAADNINVDSADNDAYAASRETTEGTVYTVSGQDWDDITAGLDSLDAAEFERLNQLNAGYRDKFGFPFVYAVKGSTKHDILKALEARLASSRDDELAEALRQVFRIARFRLDDAIIT